MKTKKILIASMMLISISFNLSSQIYKRGFGLKMGGYNGYAGIVMKEFLNQRMSVENSIMVIRPRKENRCLSFQTLLQVNQQIGPFSSMYLSVGPNIIFKQFGNNRSSELKEAELKEANLQETQLSNITYLSLNTFIGIEKGIENSGIYFSFDTGPSIHFNSKVVVKYMLNFSFKYTIKHYGFKPHHNFAKITYKKRNIFG